MRVFIGIKLNIQTQEKLYDLQRQWLSYATNKRAVYFENFYITIRFIGEMNEKEIEELFYLLKEELREVNKFKVRINDIGSFVKYDKELIWAGITTGKNELIKLNKLSNKVLLDLGFEEEKKKYRPHITLARDVTFIAEISHLPIMDVIEEVAELIIFRSHYINNKLTYTPLYTIPLKEIILDVK